MDFNKTNWLGKTVVFGKVEGLVVQQEDNFLTVVTKSGQQVSIPNNSKVIDITTIQNFSNTIVDQSIKKGPIDASWNKVAQLWDSGKLRSLAREPEVAPYANMRFADLPEEVQDFIITDADPYPEDGYFAKGAMTNDEVEDNEFENNSQTHYKKVKDIAPNYKKVDNSQNKTKSDLRCEYCGEHFSDEQAYRDHLIEEHDFPEDTSKERMNKSYVELVREYSAKKGSETSALYNNDTQYHADPVEKNPVGDAVRDIAVEAGNRAMGANVFRKQPQTNELRKKPSDEVKPKNTLPAPKLASSSLDKTVTSYLGKQGVPIGLTDSIGLRYVKPKPETKEE